jgi:hypothetical protein
MRIENLSKEVDMAAVRGGVNTAQGNNLLAGIGGASVTNYGGGYFVGPITTVVDTPIVLGVQNNVSATTITNAVSKTALGLFSSSATVW